MPKFRGKKKGMGDYNPTPEELEAYLWCIRDHIRIAPRAAQKGLSPTSWHIDIYQGYRWVTSPKDYPPVEIWKEIYKFNLFYYEKAKKKRKSTSSE